MEIELPIMSVATTQWYRMRRNNIAPKCRVTDPTRMTSEAVGTGGDSAMMSCPKVAVALTHDWWTGRGTDHLTKKQAKEGRARMAPIPYINKRVGRF